MADQASMEREGEDAGRGTVRPARPGTGPGRDRARDLCQDLNATREARPGGAPPHPAASCSARAARPSGCSRRSSATTASNILLGERVFFNFNCVVLDVCRGDDRRLHAVRPGGADLHRHAPDERRAAPEAGVRQADRDRLGRVGRRRGDHLPRRDDRLASRSSAPAAWSRGTSPRACSPPATRAASSGRSPSERASGVDHQAVEVRVRTSARSPARLS